MVLAFLFVVLPLDPLGGIEAERSRKVPVKTGTTSDAIAWRYGANGTAPQRAQMKAYALMRSSSKHTSVPIWSVETGLISFAAMSTVRMLLART